MHSFSRINHEYSLLRTLILCNRDFCILYFVCGIFHSAFCNWFEATFLSRGIISSSGLVAYIRFVRMLLPNTTTQGEHTPSSRVRWLPIFDPSLRFKKSEITRIQSQWKWEGVSTFPDLWWILLEATKERIRDGGWRYLVIDQNCSMVATHGVRIMFAGVSWHTRCNKTWQLLVVKSIEARFVLCWHCLIRKMSVGEEVAPGGQNG